MIPQGGSQQAPSHPERIDQKGEKLCAVSHAGLVAAEGNAVTKEILGFEAPQGSSQGTHTRQPVYAGELGSNSSDIAEDLPGKLRRSLQSIKAPCRERGGVRSGE